MANRADMRSDEERALAYRIHCANLRCTLDRIVDTPFDLILDLVLRDEPEFDECLRVLSRRPTYVIGVTAPLSVLEAREQSRADRGAGIAREQFGHAAYQRSYDLTIDTSTCTAHEAAQAIRGLISRSTARKA